MSSRVRWALPLIALTLLGSASPTHAVGSDTLLPFQMVRSLELVQDRIASGDHAALPMQRKLLEMIDARMRSATNEDFTDRRNVHALMIYAMSGGNPATFADSLARLELEKTDRDAGAGILGYLTGNVAQAHAALSSIDPANQPKQVAAFLYLVKGSLLAGVDGKAGMAMLDQARLHGAGTLVEEAALRRTISLAVTAGDHDRFLSASEQYARRFLRSPYASQYAEAFVSGIISLREGIDLDRVENAIDWMTAEQARTVYLRLSRRAVIDADARLLEFASANAGKYPDVQAGESDARGELYSSISSVTSVTVEEVLSRLEKLDTAGLSTRDKALLDAAKAVASEVVAPVELGMPVNYRPRQSYDQPNADAGEQDETSNLVSSTRSRLEAIDKLLEETRQ